MYDPYTGQTYTLHTAQQEIRSSGGRVVRLDAQLTNAALVEFQGTLDTDVLTADMDEAIGSSTCSPNDVQNPCDQLRAASGPPSRGRVRRGLTVWRLPPAAGRAEHRRSIGGKYLHPKMTEFALGKSHPALPQNVVFTCNEVANNYVAAKGGYTIIRSRSVRDLLDAGVEELVGAVSETGTAFLQTVAEMAYERVSLNVLALWWIGNDCANKSVRAGPFLSTRNIPFGVPSDWILVCRWEDYALSFDGGASHTTISVRVCQFEDVD